LAFQTGQIALQTGAEVIKDPNLSQVLEVFSDMPADETGASGN
jgi:hypothetical protein